MLCSHIPLPWPDTTNCRRHGNKTSRRGAASMHLVYVCCFLAFIFSIFQPPISPQPQFSSLQLSHFCFDSVRSIGFLAIKRMYHFNHWDLRIPNHQPPVLWFAMLLLKIEGSFLQMSSWCKQTTAQTLPERVTLRPAHLFQPVESSFCHSGCQHTSYKYSNWKDV